MMTEKTTSQPSSPQVRSRTLTPYVAGWTVLAALSLAYLGALATQPTLVAGYLGADEEVAEEAAAPAASLNETVAEVRTLRGTIDLFRNELIELRAQVSSQTDTARELAGRMAALEAAPAEQQVAAAEPKDAAPPVKGKKGAEPAQQAAAKANAKDEKKKLAAKAEKKKLETGSVATPAAGAITFGPPTVTTTTAVGPPSQQVGVQIATGPSVDSLRLSWTLLNERHGDSIRPYEPRYKTDVSGNQQTYDLVIGPVASPDEARRLCQELALKATPCQVTRYTGDAL